MKTVTKRFRCSPEEAAELDRRAEEQHITVSDLIRQRLNLDTQKTWGGKPPAQPDRFETRVRELAQTMPRSNARRLALKELQNSP